ncbi:hypothetical protein GRJ2_002244800 [Grus japonensis]|uniref:Uncharacterized protein n=1 Tax=Grus japonensis TaxID=30415 RepID=A0ABC9XJM9_GRUJA
MPGDDASAWTTNPAWHEHPWKDLSTKKPVFPISSGFPAWLSPREAPALNGDGGRLRGPSALPFARRALDQDLFVTALGTR